MTPNAPTAVGSATLAQRRPMSETPTQWPVLVLLGGLDAEICHDVEQFDHIVRTKTPRYWHSYAFKAATTVPPGVDEALNKFACETLGELAAIHHSEGDLLNRDAIDCLLEAFTKLRQQPTADAGAASEGAVEALELNSLLYRCKVWHAGDAARDSEHPAVREAWASVRDRISATRDKLAALLQSWGESSKTGDES